MLTHEDLIRQLTFEYHGTVAANPNWDKTLDEFLRDRGIPDKYLMVEMDSAMEYWTANVHEGDDDPFISDDPTTSEGALEAFDRWLDELVGSKCLDGTDVSYMYAYSDDVAVRLLSMGIKCTSEDREKEQY